MSRSAPPALQRAWKRACDLYPTAQWRNVYYRGAVAAHAGKPVEACPYLRDQRNTWTTSRRTAWQAGWRSMQP